MAESILGKYLDIVNEDDIECAEDYAVYLTEQEVIKSLENSGRELSRFEVSIQLGINQQKALDKGLMEQGAIHNEVRTYDELYEFVNNYENQEHELNGECEGELDSLIHVTFDEDGVINPEELEEPEPSNVVIRRSGLDDNGGSRPPQQTNEDVYEEEYEEYTEEDAEIESYLEDNMVMMSYFGNVPQASSVVRDNEGNIRVDYAVLIGVTYPSERRTESFIAQTMEDAIGCLVSAGYEYNKNYNIFILKEQGEIVSYARVNMDIDLRGVMEDN